MLLLALILATVSSPQAGEAALAKAIGGRVAADEPVDCIDPRQVRSTQVVAGTAIVYDTGRRVYVNRTKGGADRLSPDDVLVTRVEGGQLCRLDTLVLLEPLTRMQRGFVVLGSFIPYDRR